MRQPSDWQPGGAARPPHLPPPPQKGQPGPDQGRYTFYQYCGSQTFCFRIRPAVSFGSGLESTQSRSESTQSRSESGPYKIILVPDPDFDPTKSF